MKNNHWVYDLETITNCFIAVFIDYYSDNRKIFIVHSTKNDLPALLEFLNDLEKNKSWLFGYNNLVFDSQIIQYIIQNKKRLLGLSTNKLANELYDYSQEVIKKSNKREFADYPEWKLTISQVDIFKLNHWDNDAKRSSLKWIQYSMDWHNVEEMPHPHYKPVIDINTLSNIVKYCINDVESTKAIFSLPDMKEQIKLRATLSKEYNLNLHSASEPKISQEMFMHFLSDKLDINKNVLKELRTNRTNVKVKDIILPYIKFKTPEFCNTLSWFKSLDILLLEDKIEGPKHTMIYKGVFTDYGLGGLHGCNKPGIYESNDTQIIVTVDVASYYPNLAIKNKWSPAHIPNESFCELYEWFYTTRKKYDKKNPLNYLFKIILNSTYGLSKNKHSFLYDPELTFRITVNGQLLLNMLYEKISLEIPEALAIMQNTDGLEFLIPKNKLELFQNICSEWEKTTQLTLETDFYQKMIIRDVNNYIAVYSDSKKQPKCKGVFEWENLALHKNKSFLVISKAIYHYFVNGIKPEEYLESNQNIFDYCGGVKIKGDWHFIQKQIINGIYKEEKLQKLIRYYISNKGVKIIKKHSDNREIQIEAGNWMQTIFNKFKEKSFGEYDINKMYYIKKIYAEINNIENNKSQLKLFS